jgi:hypothetical protein
MYHITATDSAERDRERGDTYQPHALLVANIHNDVLLPRKRLGCVSSARFTSLHSTSPGLCNIHIKLSLLFPALPKLLGKLEAAEPGVAPWACEAWEPWAARGMGMAAEAFVGFAVGEGEDMAGRW